MLILFRVPFWLGSKLPEMFRAIRNFDDAFRIFVSKDIKKINIIYMGKK